MTEPQLVTPDGEPINKDAEEQVSLPDLLEIIASTVEALEREKLPKPNKRDFEHIPEAVAVLKESCSAESAGELPIWPSLMALFDVIGDLQQRVVALEKGASGVRAQTRRARVK